MKKWLTFSSKSRAPTYLLSLKNNPFTFTEKENCARSLILRIFRQLTDYKSLSLFQLDHPPPPTRRGKLPTSIKPYLYTVRNFLGTCLCTLNVFMLGVEHFISLGYLLLRIFGTFPLRDTHCCILTCGNYEPSSVRNCPIVRQTASHTEHKWTPYAPGYHDE